MSTFGEIPLLSTGEYSNQPLTSINSPEPAVSENAVSETDITVVNADSSYSKWTLGIGIAVFILLIIGFFMVLYYFFRADTRATQLIATNTLGQTCSGQTCGVGFYCDGNGVCQNGSGEGLGQACGSDSDCTFGLKCLTNTHVCGVDDGRSPVSPFQGRQLITTINGIKYYLTIDASGSWLSPTKPSNYSFDYSKKNGLRFQSTSPIYNDQFVGYGTNGQLTISSLSEDLELKSDRSGNIQMFNPICKTSNGGQTLYYKPNVITNSSNNLGTNLGSSGTTGANNNFVSSCNRNDQPRNCRPLKCRKHKRENCQRCLRQSFPHISSDMLNHILNGGSSGSNLTDQLVSLVQQNVGMNASINQLMTTVNSAVDAVNSSVAATGTLTMTTLTSAVNAALTQNFGMVSSGGNLGNTSVNVPMTGTTTGINLGTGIVTNQPFVTYFPVPSNNNTLSDRCPSTWESISGAQVLIFQTELN